MKELCLKIGLVGMSLAALSGCAMPGGQRSALLDEIRRELATEDPWTPMSRGVAANTARYAPPARTVESARSRAVASQPLPVPDEIVAAPAVMEQVNTVSPTGVNTPMDESAVVDEVTIQPEFLLQIAVAEDKTLDGSYLVNDIGAIELGYVGPIILFNNTAREAEAKIRQVLTGQHFKQATVSVRVLRASYGKVRVSGNVHSPGVVRIGAGDAISLNDALLRAGGVRTAAKGSRVRIVRGGMRSALAAAMPGEEYDLFLPDGTPSLPNVDLRNNDTVDVFVEGVQGAAVAEGGEKEVLVLGEVGRQGVYRFQSHEPCTMMHLVFKIGGLPAYARRNAIQVFRRTEDSLSEDVFEVDVTRIMDSGNPDMDFALYHGDRVVVPARSWTLF
jgi:protein involved in polysaccharide export with SLBB domain